MVHETSVGLKRKREADCNESFDGDEDSKSLKISKVTFIEEKEEISLNVSCQSELNAVENDSDSIKSLNDSTQNANDSIATESSKLADSFSSLSKENEISDDDGESSSLVSGDLNSSTASGLLDMSASSVNITIDGQQLAKCDRPENDKILNVDPINSSTQNANVKIKKKKRMTPEEAKLRTELRAQKEKERELKRQETLAKKEERRIQKERRDLEKKLALEEKQKKKELEEQQRLEKKQQEELQKEERHRLKQLTLQARAREKKMKEEQKQKAVEEKLKAVEEKRKMEEEKKKAEEERSRIEQEKKEKRKEAFVNFFKRSGFSISQAPPQSKEVVFRPFQVTEGMVLAPTVPPDAQKRFNKEALDQCIHVLNTQDSQSLYISLLKSKDYKILKSESKSSKDESCDDIIVISDKNAPELNLKAKLLQFCENLRPAYFGTWRKKCVNIGPRKPFGKDDLLDYEVDSDDEWDEGGPGESLTGTEEEESEDDYEVDNEFFVPHGYLSAEEEGDDEDEKRATDPEELKLRLKMKEKEFLFERKKKTTELKPVILGCFFHVDGTEDILAVEKSLKAYAAEMLSQEEILSAATANTHQSIDVANSTNLSSSPSNENKTKVPSVKRPVPEDAMPHLIKLLHANTNSKQSVIKEFQKFWDSYCQNGKICDEGGGFKDTPVVATENSQISKRQLDVTIQNISDWIKSPDSNFKKYCWWVRDEIRKKYECLDMPVPNQWNYASAREDK